MEPAFCCSNLKSETVANMVLYGQITERKLNHFIIMCKQLGLAEKNLPEGEKKPEGGEEATEAEAEFGTTWNPINPPIPKDDYF